MIRIGILKEGKVPVDERVALTPSHAIDLINSDKVDLLVQRSSVRRIKDEEYVRQDVPMSDSVESQDVLIGVKEVPIDELIPNKTYFFFSHTIKMQPYNKGLLKEVMKKSITLIDWECLSDANGNRLIGFGRYAGIVGAYNGFRAYGLRESKFQLKKAQECEDHQELNLELKKISLPPIKILLTGRGKVAKGAMEILNEIGIKKVDSKPFLTQSFDQPVFCQITFNEYFKHKNGGEFNEAHFLQNPEEYVSDFHRFAAETDFFIAGHYWDSRAPFLYGRDDAKKDDFKIKYVADISCDIDGPVASTIRPSTIADPFYGYDPVNEVETNYLNEDSICVMAVDNLPCELPRDASNDFGNMFMKSIWPALAGDDENGIIRRATIVDAGRLTEPYHYLKDWVEN